MSGKRKKPEETKSANKSRKVARHCVFPLFCGSGGSKSRLAKAAGAEPFRQKRNEQLHAIVARSKLGSQKAKSTSRPERLWQWERRKHERRRGAKHASQSKRTKHTMFRAPLDVEMLNKCAPLWHEARLEVKITPHSDHFWMLRCCKNARRYGAKHRLK